MEHLPPSISLVIATREDPPLPLNRLRVRNQMLALHMADLRFTEEEAALFFNEVMQVALSAEELSALEAHTEGWIAGLQLAALSLRELPRRDQVAAFIEGFTGSNRYVMDYLMEEILSRQPPDLQEFLLQTSLLTRLSGPLCDAVTGRTDGRAMLETVEQANLFLVPLDEERTWYRYHALFADLLRERLQRRVDPPTLARLHRQAARWYAEKGEVSDAIHHALAAEDYEQTAALILRYGNTLLLQQGQLVTLLRWLEALPETLIVNQPELCLYHAMGLATVGEITAAERRMQQAERGLEALLAPVRVDFCGEIYF